MSEYTTEVRFICESIAGLQESVGVKKVDDVLMCSYNSVFGSFPIFDETYRETLCCKILKHYYTREICEESVGLWKLRMNSKMNEIMPYYNQLYLSTKMKFDVFDNVDYSKIVESEISGDNTSTQTQEGNGTNAFSDTPQGGLQDLMNNTYLTNASKSNQTATGEGTGHYSQQGKQTEKYKGKNTSYSNSKLLNEYRTTMLNIDTLVIEEFADCFMQIW